MSAPLLTVEPASQRDIPALCALLALLFAQEAEFVADRAAQARGLERIVGHADVGTILVARDGEAIVGMVSLLFTVSTALGARAALLEDMIVAPDRRGRGIGSRLLVKAIELARSKGCGRVTLLTDGANEVAQRFYAKHGFARSGMLPMRLALV